MNSLINNMLTRATQVSEHFSPLAKLMDHAMIRLMPTVNAEAGCPAGACNAFYQWSSTCFSHCELVLQYYWFGNFWCGWTSCNAGCGPGTGCGFH